MTVGNSKKSTFSSFYTLYRKLEIKDKLRPPKYFKQHEMFPKLRNLRLPTHRLSNEELNLLFNTWSYWKISRSGEGEDGKPKYMKSELAYQRLFPLSCLDVVFCSMMIDRQITPWEFVAMISKQSSKQIKLDSHITTIDFKFKISGDESPIGRRLLGLKKVHEKYILENLKSDSSLLYLYAIPVRQSEANIMRVRAWIYVNKDTYPSKSYVEKLGLEVKRVMETGRGTIKFRYAKGFEQSSEKVAVFVASEKPGSPFRHDQLLANYIKRMTRVAQPKSSRSTFMM